MAFGKNSGRLCNEGLVSFSRLLGRERGRQRAYSAHAAHWAVPHFKRKPGRAQGESRGPKQQQHQRDPGISSSKFFNTHRVLKLRCPARQTADPEVPRGRGIEARVGRGSSEEGVFLKAAGPGEVPRGRGEDRALRPGWDPKSDKGRCPKS